MGGVVRVVVSAALLLAIANLTEARSDGAIALGLPADVAKEGAAFGAAWNHRTAEEAQADALARCRAFQGAAPGTVKLCKVVRTFRQECLAIALDREPSTPGIGWAVSPTKSEAEHIALQNCKSTAGPDRQGFCQVTQSQCEE